MNKRLIIVGVLILGLAILAPEISHYLIHPIMRALHLEKKEPEKTEDQAK